MTSCPACMAPLDDVSRISGRCRACTFQFAAPQAVAPPPVVAQAFIATHAGMRVCPGCGVIAPTRATSCAICRTEYGATPQFVPERTAGAPAWAFALADVACASCGARTYVGHVHVGASPACSQCGKPIPFDDKNWQDLFRFVHDVADLSSPKLGDDVAHASPYRAIGTTETKADSSVGSVHMVAAPGHPMCGRCRAPVEVKVPGDGSTSTFCARCGATAVYRVPDAARRFHPQLVGVVAEAHRADVAPNAQAAGGAWLAFVEASPLRLQLGAPRGAPRADRERDDDAPAKKPKRSGAGRTFAWILLVVCLLGGLGAGAYFGYDWWSHRPKPVDPEPEEDDDEPPPVASAPKPKPFDRASFTDVPSCKCAVTLGGKPVEVQLAMRVDHEKAKGAAHHFDVSWILDVPGGKPLLLEGGAPSRKLDLAARGLSVEMGCSGADVVVATGTTASAWSLDTRTERWKATLPASVSYWATPPSSGLAATCIPITIEPPTVSLGLENDKFAHLRLTDGATQPSASP